LFVLDTCILKEIGHPTPNKNVLNWYQSIDETDLFISVVAMMEQRKGIERKRKTEPALASQLELKFAELRDRFSGRILPIDTEVAQEWGRMLAEREKHTIDVSIAASARVKNYTVVTENISHFKERGVRLINPHIKPALVIEK
jgi:toxin FitB